MTSVEYAGIGRLVDITWVQHCLANDDGKPVQLFTAITKAPTLNVVGLVDETLGDEYSCELWASAPAILPLQPPEGYDKVICHDPTSEVAIEDWAPEVLKEWGMFFQKGLINAEEIKEMRSYVDEEISKTEDLMKEHHPEIEIGKDTFHFKEIASRGNGRFDLLLQSESAKEFVEQKIRSQVTTLLEKTLGTDSELDFDVSVIYSKPGSQNQGWHCDGEHQKGAKDSEWEPDGWKTILAETYALCLFIPLVDINEETGYTQYWPGSHRNRSLVGFGPVAEIAQSTWNGKCSAGDAMWYDYRLFHRGTANTSSLLRPIVQVLFKKKWYVERANYGEDSITYKEEEETEPDTEPDAEHSEDANKEH
ncbi:unnamed protein product [Cylindrotheca closterium]|uniref:Phytanoyl-CoA dioxygenase n=1 Tax=Cylindrotheca closterium TaxID=2856 RepID=A0AAD2G8C3_9STRA|nr:unnamed protein product [Cylindrotheca closterium]